MFGKNENYTTHLAWKRPRGSRKATEGPCEDRQEISDRSGGGRRGSGELVRPNTTLQPCVLTTVKVRVVIKYNRTLNIKLTVFKTISKLSTTSS